MEQEVIFMKGTTLPEAKRLDEENKVVNFVFSRSGSRVTDVVSGSYILRGLLIDGKEIVSLIRVDKVENVDNAVSMIEGTIVAKLESHVRSDTVRIEGRFGRYFNYVGEVLLRLHKS